MSRRAKIVGCTHENITEYFLPLQNMLQVGVAGSVLHV